MPPGGGVSQADLSTFAAWVNGGESGVCDGGGADLSMGPGPNPDLSMGGHPRDMAHIPDLSMGTCTPDTWTNWAGAWIKSTCAYGCHNHSFGSNPSYATIKGNISNIASRIQSNNMPPGGAAAADKTRFAKWVSCGEPQ